MPIVEPARFCVRPWTASSLGVFEVIPTVEGGRLVITGGHNTGGFAQAPAIAAAVLAELTGRRHTMDVLYHPLRMRHTELRPTRRLT
jgi:D-amino-acid dehydrogenase